MAEPTADLLAQFASGAVKPQDNRPQGWLLSLFSRSRGLLNNARLQFSAHGGMALLRDAQSGHERYLTRFHAARQFLAEAVVRSAEAGEREQDQFRRQLLDAVKQLEQIHNGAENGEAVEALASSGLSAERLAEQSSASASNDLPLSFFNDEEATRVVTELTQGESVAGAEQVLSDLRDALLNWEPDSEPLCEQVFTGKDGFEEVIQRTFSTMSGADISSNQRAWLSQLGAFLINLSSRWSQAFNRAKQRAEVSASLPPTEPDSVETPAPPAGKKQKSKSAASAGKSPKDAKRPSKKPQPAESEGGDSPAEAAERAPPVPPAAPEKASSKAPATASRPLNAQQRRKLKEFMAERFAKWQRETGVATEAEVLTLLAKAIKRLEKDTGVADTLVQPLKAEGFLTAQRQLDATTAQAPAKLQSALKNLTLLCQDLQTAYFQRLRELLALGVFNDLQQRRQTMADLAAQWAEAAEAAGGSRSEEARMIADRAALKALAGQLRSQNLPGSVTGVASALSGLESLSAAHRLLSAPARGEPLAMLFRSECKGLVEDLMIRCAFDRAPRDGWESLIELLGTQSPRSESELVAMVSRKLDALGQTSVHENFLNPGKRLQFRNFLQWVTHGYRLSPHYQASDAEESVLRHTQWLLEQILSMQFEDHVESATGDSALDQFLAAEAETGHAVYNIYWQEIQRRFDGHWTDSGGR